MAGPLYSAYETRIARTTSTSCTSTQEDGWRLVQIFAPGVVAFGAARYYEFIFEEEVAEEASTADTQPGREVA